MRLGVTKRKGGAVSTRVLKASGVAMAVFAVVLVPTSYAFASTPHIFFNPTNGSYAGYTNGGVPAAATLSVKFTLPNAGPCTATDTGIAATILLTETSGAVTGAGLIFGCQSGVARYMAAIEDNNTGFGVGFIPVPGDVIKMVATESGGASTVTVKDMTQNKTTTVNGGGATNSTFLVGMDQVFGNGVDPVPDFGTLTFKHVKLNGVGITGATAYDYENGSDIQISTGALNAAGTKFTETFQNAT